MEVYTIKQVAERYNVSTRTVYNWIKDGLLHAFRLGGKGDYRVRDIDLAKFEER
jgi:excisionase family DNA binding protein